MISAIEKRKLVYVLNRDSTGKPTIASPLEAHRSRTIVLNTVGLDNGYDNPIFASLEYMYAESEEEEERLNKAAQESNIGDGAVPEKQLAYYELDLGLNHVSRRWATTTHRTAYCLAALPGGMDGPSGVLVAGEDWIEYLHEGLQKKVVCAIPRRELHPPDRGILIIQMIVHRQKKTFFALAQSELGDLYKITLRLDPKDKSKVVGLSVSILDTLPVGNALNVNKLGFLFVPAEFGDHALYQFERIDVEDVAATMTSEQTYAAFINQKSRGIEDETRFFDSTVTASTMACRFVPTMLRNMIRIATMESLAPTTGIMVGELVGSEVSPQMYTLVGRGPRSSLRILRHGAAVTELAVSNLPGVPGAVYTIRENVGNQDTLQRLFDKYIVVSFADATLVLSVGDSVEEVGKESGFLTNAPTLTCSSLSNNCGIVQVHPSGVRIINNGRARQWDCPGLKRIECASANESQVVIALAGGDMIYFELDPMSGNLTEKTTVNLGVDISCVDVGTIPTGRTRSLFAAVGFRDLTVRILSLEPGKLLVQRSSTALRARPHQLALQSMAVRDDFSGGGVEDIVLTIGLDDGSCLRTIIDSVTGTISASPTRRFLGARPVSVSRITLNGIASTLLLSSRPWISRPDPKSGKHIMAPLSYVPLDHGCTFSSEAVREGIVATAGATLRILSVDTQGAGFGTEDEIFNAQKIELRYTPRHMCLLSTGGGNVGVPSLMPPEKRKLVLAIVESDHNDYGLEEKKAMGFDSSGMGNGGKQTNKDKNDEDEMDIDSDGEDENDSKEKSKNDDELNADGETELRTTPIRGPYPPSQGYWSSCVRLVDPSNGCETLDCIEMGRNEAALCCASVRFHSRGGEALLAVSTVTGMTLHPLKQTMNHIALYRIVNGERLQLLHRTEIEDGPVLALAHFQGRLLVGAGNTLKLFEMGKRQLLKKGELRGLPTMVKCLQAAGDRAYIGDMLNSMQFIKYDATANRLLLVASDRTSRPITCQELLDMNTIAVGDKFGNITILRLPRGAEATAVDVNGTRGLWDSSRDDLTPRLDTLCNYYVGEVVTGMTRGSLVAGGTESLIYVTVTGRIGALVPFTSREDVEFYTELEAHMRTEAPRPTGREPQSYRSYYAPVKHIIDGDLCGMFGKLGYNEQKKIADKLDRTVSEIVKKLEDTRNSLL